MCNKYLLFAQACLWSDEGHHHQMAAHYHRLRIPYKSAVCKNASVVNSVAGKVESLDQIRNWVIVNKHRAILKKVPGYFDKW
jgi:hypothetical protein